MPGGGGGRDVGPGAERLTMYWHQHQRSREKIRGDWFLSGDRYRQDEDGYFWYEGRVDDMMKVGGLWVSPIEIENRLMEHPSVREAAVVAIDIEHMSRIKAVVILAEGVSRDEDLDAELQVVQIRLQRHQFPHVLEYVDDFPDRDREDPALQTAGGRGLSRLLARRADPADSQVLESLPEPIEVDAQLTRGEPCPDFRFPRHALTPRRAPRRRRSRSTTTTPSSSATTTSPGPTVAPCTAPGGSPSPAWPSLSRRHGRP